MGKHLLTFFYTSFCIDELFFISFPCKLYFSLTSTWLIVFKMLSRWWMMKRTSWRLRWRELHSFLVSLLSSGRPSPSSLFLLSTRSSQEGIHVSQRLGCMWHYQECRVTLGTPSQAKQRSHFYGRRRSCQSEATTSVYLNIFLGSSCWCPPSLWR